METVPKRKPFISRRTFSSIWSKECCRLWMWKELTAFLLFESEFFSLEYWTWGDKLTIPHPGGWVRVYSPLFSQLQGIEAVPRSLLKWPFPLQHCSSASLYNLPQMVWKLSRCCAVFQCVWLPPSSHNYWNSTFKSECLPSLLTKTHSSAIQPQSVHCLSLRQT